MKKIKENKSVQYILGIILLALLCCNLPSLLFISLCLKEDIFRPPHTEVLVSACKKPVAIGVPGGDVVFVSEGLTDKLYLLDLHTGEKQDVPNDPLLLDHGIFLSSELVWLEVGSTQFIRDLTDGQRYELLDLGRLPRLEGGKFDPKYYVYFQSAEQVFIHHSENTLIALTSDFRTNQNGRVVLSLYSNTLENGKLLEQLMKNLGVDYEIVDFSLYDVDVPSPAGRFYVHYDGIYISGTNTPIVTRNMGVYFRGWYYDESAVIFQGPEYFLVSNTLIGSHYPHPRPVLKLSLPE